ncbi:MAG: DEAD/DEAH box helicase [Planctomycetes bacterium]|nr:DEAD/DEAH box helicase [Planctomycetota bacterium]
MEEIAARPARYAEVEGGLDEPVRNALEKQGIDRLFTHQTEAIEILRGGDNLVVVTGTASGKTVCYTVPVVEELLEDNLSTMLFIYPTKALAQDQLRALGEFQSESAGIEFLSGTYDGDTPGHLRRRLRDGASVILTNPDMLHQGILPHHGRWNRFFTHLKYVVVDEIHAYRGVFGSHLANVIRRLRRVCKHYGSDPQFVSCSATISNPREHAETICGCEMELVDEDGSPQGRKKFVLWNPPPLNTAARGKPDEWRVGGDRKSPLWEAVHLMAGLVREGIQTIAFVRTRRSAELVFKRCRDLLRQESRKLADSVHAYRGGYLPEERREIERKLAEKELLGVASTNALELGIDIGTLDACIICGYPGTIASLWQQGGRAGRGTAESVVFLVGQNSPIDQYLMIHSDYLFAQNPEQAVVDPDNPHVSVGHIRCATHELPLPEEDADIFGPYGRTILELLEEEQAVRNIEGIWYWAQADAPAPEVNLRNIAGPVYTIQDEISGRVIGTMDEVSVFTQLHDHAVYLHGAETYFVNQLDLEQKIARVEQRDLEYYTQAVTSSEIGIDETEEEREWRQSQLGYGDVTVTTTVPMFKKIRFNSRDSLGFEKLELPPQHLETVGMWFTPPEELVEKIKHREMVVGEALTGIANALVEVAPLFVMCDPRDIGTVVNSSCLGRDALFLYDRYPGGMGYARRCLARTEEIMTTVHRVIEDCGCEDGCPSCVGAAVPAFAMTDIDSAVRGRIPDKAAAHFLLEEMID